MTFQQKLDAIITKNNSLLCVGLDPDLDKLPKHLLSLDDPIFEFNKAIIDATHDLVCVYKPNSAFYEAEGIKGLQALKKTVGYIQKIYPHVPIILDAKRADIGNTARMYAKSAFEYLQVDAVTVYPNLGLDSLIPFLNYKDKFSFFLIKTSNPDSKMFQDLQIDGIPYYLKMSDIISKWPQDNFGIFVGATYPKELREIRNVFQNRVFLSAGFGVQGGNVEQAVKAGLDNKKGGIMFNSSRSLLYISHDQDFDEKVREEAKKLKEEINKFRF